MTCLQVLLMTIPYILSKCFTVNALPLNLDYEVIAEEQFYKHCVCVPFWQCKDDFTRINGDGLSILDIRSKKSDSQGQSSCTGYFDVCCKVECGSREKSGVTRNRILGDYNEAAFGEFPWMLGILRGSVYRCGGSLIHPKVALTAAHCVNGPGKYKVRAGEWHWELFNEPMAHQDRYVENIIVHPKFHPGSLKNDVALLVLDSPFTLTRNVGIVCLPSQKYEVDINKCIVSGWGKNSYRKGTYQSVLKKVNIPIMARDKCTTILRESVLGPFFTLHGSFICAGGQENKDTCKGDGGSPLICPVSDQSERYEQIGIVSWGLTCGITNTPGVYVNVIAFIDWIDKQMFNLGLDTDIYRYH